MNKFHIFRKNSLQFEFNLIRFVLNESCTAQYTFKESISDIMNTSLEFAGNFAS